MNGPSRNALINRVDIYLADLTLAGALDADGGITNSAYPASPSVTSEPCSVQITAASRIETDQMRVSAASGGFVHFGRALGLKVNDRINWTDGSGMVRTLYVLPEQDNAGRGLMWSVPVDERL